MFVMEGIINVCMCFLLGLFEAAVSFCCFYSNVVGRKSLFVEEEGHLRKDVLYPGFSCYISDFLDRYILNNILYILQV